MDISVVIPAHGRTDLLVRCLVSLKRGRQGDGDYEICVVDDGGGIDERSVRDGAEPDYPLVWRSFPVSRGRSAARNEGIRSTSGGIVVFLDSDMEAREGFLAAHSNRHRNRPRTAVIGGIEWPSGGSFLRYIGSRGVAKLTPGDEVPCRYFVTGNASVARSDLPAGNAFDETLPGWGGEDLDLGLRLREAGVTFVSAPEAASYHHFDGDLRGHVARTRLYGEKTLPVLTGRRPELARDLRLDLLESPLWRAAVSGAVAGPVCLAARIFDRLPLPDAVFDYLTFAAYARGWLTGSGGGRDDREERK